jgi:hypothetical protein
MSQEENMTEETNETVAGQPVETPVQAPGGTGAGIGAGAETPRLRPAGADETAGASVTRRSGSSPATRCRRLWSCVSIA